MALYQYSPLETESTIRLLELHPPKPDDPSLRVSLRHELLDGNGTSYEALSYTWGSSNFTADVQCIDGTKFTITENLNTALTALRLPDKSRVLWVDALCINQLDILEKNLQVPLMRDIYKNANVTVVYLGEEADNSQIAMEYSTRIFALAAATFAYVEDMALAIILGGFPAQTPPPDEVTARALVNLCARPWFRRAWVVQEFAVAKIAMFVCGASTCHWGALYFAQSELRQHHINLESLVSGTVRLAGIYNVEPITSIRASLLLQVPQKFDILMTQTANTLSKLPHDKLYSVLGLSDDTQSDDSLRPRYDLPAEEVYCTYARWMASTQEGCLRLLSLAQIADRQLELPSWVPDWSAGNYRQMLGIKFIFDKPGSPSQPGRLQFDASATLSSNTPLKPFVPEVRNVEILIVRGMIRDMVFSCSPPYRMSALAGSRPNLCRVVRDAQMMSRIIYNEIKAAVGDAEMPAELYPDIFARRLLLYCTADNRTAPESWKEVFSNALDVLQPTYNRLQSLEITAESDYGRQRLREFLGHEAMDAILDDIKEYNISEADRKEAFRRYNEDWAFYSALQRNTAGMALCRTLTGSLALVPDSTREDDRICIISGAAVPFVLRPLDNDDGEQKQTFKLIGEAIIPGKMRGEYVLGAESNTDRRFPDVLFDSEEVEICIR